MSVIAYVDGGAGIAGDMVVGALIDAGLALERLREELARLPLAGYEIRAERCLRAGVAATKFDVLAPKGGPERDWLDIRGLLEGSSLSPSVKSRAIHIFRRLAEVEAQIHDCPVDSVHFHEIGAVDSIVDIVSAAIGLDYFNIARLYGSPVNLGRGSVATQHGVLPVPAPATLALAKGIPVYADGPEGELTTPTGMAILATQASGFGAIPDMRPERIGYGAGTRTLPIANVVRLTIGTAGAEELAGDEVTLIEANIDDMNPEFFGHVVERLFSAGALDVWLTPVIMKKGRPGTVVSVLAAAGPTDVLTDIMFAELTTLGVRYRAMARRKLERNIVEVGTEFGTVQVKLALRNGVPVNAAPEYESCRKAALSNKVPIKQVFDAAKAALNTELRDGVTGRSVLSGKD